VNHLRHLPRPPRRQVPEELAFHRTAEALEHMRSLLRRPVRTPAELEMWVRHRMEAEACLRETLLLARLDFAEQVADSGRRDWLDTLHQDMGAVRMDLDHRLDQHYLDSPARDALPAPLQEACEGPLEQRRSVWMETNLVLLERLHQLELEYIQVLGHLQADWSGAPATLAVLRHHLEGAGPIMRHKAWELRASLLAAARPELEDLLDEVLALREQVARNAERGDWNHYAGACGLGQPPTGTLVDGPGPGEWPEAPGPIPVEVMELSRLSLGQVVDEVLDWLGYHRPAEGRTLALLKARELLDLEDRPGKFGIDLCAWLPERRLPFVRMGSCDLFSDLGRFLRLVHAAHRLLRSAAGEAPHACVATVEAEDLRRATDVVDGLLTERAVPPADLRHILAWWRAMRRRELAEARHREAWSSWLHAHPGQTREERRRRWREGLAGGLPAGLDPAAVEDTLFLTTSFFLPAWGAVSAAVLEEGWRGRL